MAVAANTGEAAVNTVFAGWANEIVLAAGKTVNVRARGVAAAKVALPPCVAVMEHGPPDANLIVPFAVTVQTFGVVER